MNSKGSVFVEAAIAMPFLFFLIIASSELLILAYANCALHFITTVAMREAVVGPSVFEGLTQPEFIQHRIVELSRKFLIPAEQAALELCVLSESRTQSSGQCWPDRALNLEGGETIVARVQYHHSSLLFGATQLSALEVVQNERW